MFKKLQNDVKEAMIAKDTLRRDVLKMVLNKAREMAKETKTEEISDEMVYTAAKKEIKQLKQTIDSLKGREDSDLYKESVKKLEIIETNYLPKQLSENELRTSLEKFIADNNLKEVGNKAMKNIMMEYKDKADGKLINQVAKELLN